MTAASFTAPTGAVRQLCTRRITAPPSELWMLNVEPRGGGQGPPGAVSDVYGKIAISPAALGPAGKARRDAVRRLTPAGRHTGGHVYELATTMVLSRRPGGGSLSISLPASIAVTGASAGSICRGSSDPGFRPCNAVAYRRNQHPRKPRPEAVEISLCSRRRRNGRCRARRDWIVVSFLRRRAIARPAGHAVVSRAAVLWRDPGSAEANRPTGFQILAGDEQRHTGLNGRDVVAVANSQRWRTTACPGGSPSRIVTIGAVAAPD